MAETSSVQHAVEQLERLSLSRGDVVDTGESSHAATSRAEVPEVHGVDWTQVAQLAESCANSLRTEQARTDLGNTSLIPTCSKYLDASTNEPSSSDVLAARTQLCRIIGNLVLDHPANRVKCRHAQIPQRILALLTARPAPPGPSAQEIEWLQAVKACIGALLNLSIDTPEIASLLYDLRALEILSNILSTYRIASWSASPTSSLALVAALTAEWTINLVKEVLQQEGTDISYIAPTLSSIITSLPLPDSPGFATSHSPEAERNDQIYTLVSADLSILTTASELLEVRAYNDTKVQEMIAFRPLPDNDTATLSYLQGMAAIVESAHILPAWKSVIEEDKANGDDSLEAEKTFSTFKAEIARIIIGVCSNDKVMDDAFNRDSRTSWLLDTCRRWLISGRSDPIITGSTVLANLARKDEYCITLVQDRDLATILAAILEQYTPKTPGLAIGGPGEAVQVLHGVIGLTKNLSIAGPNKQTLCDAGVIEPCLSLLSKSFDMVVPLQNAAVGVLKHLCAGNISSSLKVILPTSTPGTSAVVSLTPGGHSDSSTQASPLNDILSLIQRTNDVRLQCEATRLLINIVRSLYSSRSISSPVTPSALDGLEMGLAKVRAKSVIESSEGVVEAISEIIRTGEKYPILVNEGIVALTLLSTTENGARFSLKALTEEIAIPAQTENAQDASGSSLVAPAAADASGVNGYHRDRSMSRAVSLNPKNAPTTAVNVLVRWLNNYAIAAKDMPAELAANALSLLEGVSRIPGSRQLLPVSEVIKCLEGVVLREASSPNELLLREVAQRNLERLTQA